MGHRQGVRLLLQPELPDVVLPPAGRQGLGGQGLTGKKVGSRVLIVVPPSLGYGDNPPQGSDIKKDSTMVFTVDILAAI
ncbi:hypothetical protein GCM10020256_63370 [Streptomyces thermocoprophilus]